MGHTLWKILLNCTNGMSRRTIRSESCHTLQSRAIYIYIWDVCRQNRPFRALTILTCPSVHVLRYQFYILVNKPSSKVRFVLRGTYQKFKKERSTCLDGGRNAGKCFFTSHSIFLLKAMGVAELRMDWQQLGQPSCHGFRSAFTSKSSANRELKSFYISSSGSKRFCAAATSWQLKPVRIYISDGRRSNTEKHILLQIKLLCG